MPEFITYVLYGYFAIGALIALVYVFVAQRRDITLAIMLLLIIILWPLGLLWRKR